MMLVRPRCAVLFLVVVAVVCPACGDESTVAKQGRYDGDGARVDVSGSAVEDSGTKRVRNIVVLVADGLRADAIDGKVMPHLAELAREGVRFTRAHTASAWKDPSLTSVLTGRLPREHGCVDSDRVPRLPQMETTYAEVLRNGYGYETAAFTQQDWHRAQPWSILQGFARGTVSDRPFAISRSGEVLDAWNAARDRSRPFCVLMQTSQIGPPYDSDASAPLFPADLSDEAALTRAFLTNAAQREALSKKLGIAYRRTVNRVMAGESGQPLDRELVHAVRTAYERRLRGLDIELRDTIAALRKRGLLHNTMLVITSSHGQAFGEHQTLGHGQHAHAELTHVPLVVLGLSEAGVVVDQVVGAIDIFPTFFAWAGLAEPVSTRGKSFLPSLRGEDLSRVVASELVLTERFAAPGSRTLWVARRSSRWSFLIDYDITKGKVTERLFRADDFFEEHDLAFDGEIGQADFESFFCQAVDEARESIWTEVDSAQQRVGTVYGAGIEVVQTARPRPCRATR